MAAHKIGMVNVASLSFSNVIEKYWCRYKKYVQEVVLFEVTKKDSPYLTNETKNDGDGKSISSTPHSSSSSSFSPNIVPVIVMNATTFKEQISSLTRAIEGLTKHVQEQEKEKSSKELQVSIDGLIPIENCKF